MCSEKLNASICETEEVQENEGVKMLKEQIQVQRQMLIEMQLHREQHAQVINALYEIERRVSLWSVASSVC